MSKIVKDVLLERDKFIPEIPLKQIEFIYSACGPFTRDKRIEKFMQTGDTRYI